MRSQEFEGKSIDEAIEKACDEFQVSRTKISIEIMSEGTAGFLGFMGNKKARIKASLLSLDEALEASFEESLPPSAPPAALAAEMAALPTCRSKPDNCLPGRAKSILEGILSRMHLDCPVNIVETQDKIILNIQSDGGGQLIGKRGQNLDALQYIINKAVHKSGNGHKIIVVDTESYRKKREESLIALATKLSEKVKKTQKAVTLSYLNAHHRRIIHLALQDDSSVITKSRGEGEYRKIIIVPAKKE